MDFQLAFNKSKGIKVSNVIDHFVKSVTDDQYNALLDDDLILESCSIEDIENTLVIGIPCVPDMMLEAITTKAVSLKNTMRAFARSLNKETAPQGITVNFDKSGDAIEVSKPRKSGLVAVQTGKLTLSDGQSVSIVFHAPDNDPLKINPTDTLIAFRFLLNSRDVTHLVAPKGGKDVSLVQVTTALSQVIGKNSEKFKAAQSEKNSLKQEIDDSDRQALELEAELAQISGKADQIDADIVTTNGNIDTLQKRIDRENDIQAKLRAELDALTPPAATTTSDIPNAGGNNKPANIGDVISIAGEGYEITRKHSDSSLMIKSLGDGVEMLVTSDELTELGITVANFNDESALANKAKKQQEYDERMAEIKLQDSNVRETAQNRLNAISKANIDYVKSIVHLEK
ncbi:hypothetical protein [Photobacterium leiognathi]|uniref:defense against restriction DarA-related protein n=1 Tax=Photobacterium leiognathi TaxID=553611 RepID=UPI003AF38DB8